MGKLIELSAGNISEEHICCAIFDKKSRLQAGFLNIFTIILQV